MPRSVQSSGLGGATTFSLPQSESLSYGILSIVASYSGILSAPGRITISVGGTPILDFNFDSSPIIIDEDISTNVNESLDVVLSGVTLQTGRLNVNYVANAQ